MAKFEVNYTAIVDCKTTIEAESEEEAYRLIDTMIDECELDFNKDSTNVEFTDFLLESEE